MSVISISVTESSEQVISGVPRFVIIEASIPSVIFYTFDGSDPTTMSDIYVDNLYLPTNPGVTLKIYATNGLDSSSIITENYASNITDGTRFPHAGTDAQAGARLDDLYPFGIQGPQPDAIYTSTANSGINAFDPAKSNVSNGFDGSGNANNFTNKEFNVENYEIKYSTSDSEGNVGKLIGTLPANVKIVPPVHPPNTTDQFTNTFDPRAFVIYQDFSKENPLDPPQINRQFFSLEDPETARAGALLLQTGEDAPLVTGSFVRSAYNPRTNMMTYYYFESSSNRWIISTSEYKPNGTFDGNLAGGMVLPGNGGPGAKFVYQWTFGARRVLF